MKRVRPAENQYALCIGLLIRNEHFRLPSQGGEGDFFARQGNVAGITRVIWREHFLSVRAEKAKKYRRYFELAKCGQAENEPPRRARESRGIALRYAGEKIG